MRCGSCGAENAEAAQFCSACGARAGQANQHTTQRPAFTPPRLENLWSDLKEWRITSILGPVTDQRAARGLVMGGAAAMAIETAVTLIDAVGMPFLAAPALATAACAAGLWYGNSRIAALVGVAIMGFGFFAALGAGFFVNPFALVREAVILTGIAGAVRGAFLWHDLAARQATQAGAADAVS